MHMHETDSGDASLKFEVARAVRGDARRSRPAVGRAPAEGCRWPCSSARPAARCPSTGWSRACGATRPRRVPSRACRPTCSTSGRCSSPTVHAAPAPRVLVTVPGGYRLDIEARAGRPHPVRGAGCPRGRRPAGAGSRPRRRGLRRGAGAWAGRRARRPVGLRVRAAAPGHGWTSCGPPRCSRASRPSSTWATTMPWSATWAPWSASIPCGSGCTPSGCWRCTGPAGSPMRWRLPRPAHRAGATSSASSRARRSELNSGDPRARPDARLATARRRRRPAPSPPGRSRHRLCRDRIRRQPARRSRPVRRRPLVASAVARCTRRRRGDHRVRGDGPVVHRADLGRRTASAGARRVRLGHAGGAGRHQPRRPRVRRRGDVGGQRAATTPSPGSTRPPQACRAGAGSGHDPTRPRRHRRDLWVANFGDGTVIRVNLRPAEVQTIHVGSQPPAIAAGPPGSGWPTAATTPSTASTRDRRIADEPIDGRRRAGRPRRRRRSRCGWPTVATGRSCGSTPTGDEMSAPIRVGHGAARDRRIGDDVWVADELSQSVTRIDVATTTRTPGRRRRRADRDRRPRRLGLGGREVLRRPRPVRPGNGRADQDPASGRRSAAWRSPTGTCGSPPARSRQPATAGARSGWRPRRFPGETTGSTRHGLRRHHVPRRAGGLRRPAGLQLLGRRTRGRRPRPRDLGAGAHRPRQDLHLHPAPRDPVLDRRRGARLRLRARRAARLRPLAARRDFYAGIVGAQGCIHHPASCDLSKGVITTTTPAG